MTILSEKIDKHTPNPVAIGRRQGARVWEGEVSIHNRKVTYTIITVVLHVVVVGIVPCHHSNSALRGI